MRASSVAFMDPVVAGNVEKVFHGLLVLRDTEYRETGIPKGREKEGEDVPGFASVIGRSRTSDAFHLSR